MRSIIKTTITVLVVGLLFSGFATRSTSNTQRTLPNPVLIFMGNEYFETGGKQWTRYRFDVVNQDVYPNEMFAASPDLPPCGSNTKAARTWVDINDQSGKRLQSFCAFGSNSDLGKVWFALERDVLPPSWIYVEMNDRKTSTKYKSNLAETVE